MSAENPGFLRQTIQVASRRGAGLAVRVFVRLSNLHRMGIVLFETNCGRWLRGGLAFRRLLYPAWSRREAPMPRCHAPTPHAPTSHVLTSSTPTSRGMARSTPPICLSLRVGSPKVWRNRASPMSSVWQDRLNGTAVTLRLSTRMFAIARAGEEIGCNTKPRSASWEGIL